MKAACQELTALKGPAGELGQGLLTPSPLGALGSAPDWLQMVWGAAGRETGSWMDRWTHSQVWESEPAGSVPAPPPPPRPETTHLAPPSLASLKLLLPWLSPKKDMGEEPQGGVIVSSRLTLRSTNSYPPPSPVQIRHHSEICDLPTTCARWARPVPAGTHSQAKGRRGRLPDRSPGRQTQVYRPLSGHGKGAPGEAEPHPLPHNATLCLALSPWSQS